MAKHWSLAETKDTYDNSARAMARADDAPTNRGLDSDSAQTAKAKYRHELGDGGFGEGSLQAGGSDWQATDKVKKGSIKAGVGLKQGTHTDSGELTRLLEVGCYRRGGGGGHRRKTNRLTYEFTWEGTEIVE